MSAQFALDDSIDMVPPGTRSEAYGETALASAHNDCTARIRVASTSSTMIGLKSNVLLWGRTRRTGARIGSVAWMR